MPTFMTLRMRLPVWPFHVPIAHAAAEIRHAVEHRVNFGHHVFAIGHDGGAARRAQRHVQYCAPLGYVDLLAREHRIDPRAQS